MLMAASSHTRRAPAGRDRPPPPPRLPCSSLSIQQTAPFPAFNNPSQHPTHSTGSPHPQMDPLPPVRHQTTGGTTGIHSRHGLPVQEEADPPLSQRLPRQALRSPPPVLRRQPRRLLP